MSKIAPLLDLLSAKTEFAEKLNPIVSKANVAWHIDHSLRVINSVLIALKQSNTADYKPAINLKRSYFLIVGRIPRGRIKAPKTVRSFDEITLSGIENQLGTARSLLSELESMDKNNFFTHPFLGQFNLRQTLVFLELHTKHHLKIINDIITK